MSVDVSIQCDWCRGFCDGGEAIACEKCHEELIKERDEGLERIEALINSALESSR